VPSAAWAGVEDKDLLDKKKHKDDTLAEKTKAAAKSATNQVTPW
jgi:hypothetical protein